MKNFLIALGAMVSLSSCMDYATVRAINNPNEKIALQDFYSPCCGSCGQRIVVDDFKGKQYALQVNCEIENEYSRLCTPLRLGTQKHVLAYKRKRVVSEEYYKPVYDTAELKKMYPKVERGEYFDSGLATKPVLPLTAIDSLLIEKYFSLTQKQCSDQYIRLIKGFISVEKVNLSPIDKKKVKFKAK
jgi:hypothetical protein